MMSANTKKLGCLIILGILVIFLGCAGVVSAAGVAPEHDSSSRTVKGYDGSVFQASLPVTDVYLIQNESNWRYVVDHISPTYTSANLVLTDDILFLSDVESLSSFSGTIYGNGFRFVNFTQSGNAAHGLINGAGDGCILNYVRMIDSNIESSTGYVGGLVGKIQSSADVKLYGCAVEWSTIKAGSNYAGGLVGDASSGKLLINASFVDRVNLQSRLNYLGGLVGYIKNGNIADSWVNGSEIYADGNNVGGLIGYGDFTVGMHIRNASVMNSRIWGKSQFLGGLLGYGMGSAGFFDGCHVEYATVISINSVNVGGLIGHTVSPVTMSGSIEVKSSWVKGMYPVTVGSLFGSGSSSGNAPTHTSVWSTSGTTSTTPTDNNFDNTSTADYAFKVAGIGSPIDRYGYTAGKDYGYTLYPVTVETDGHGTAAADKTEYYKYGTAVRLNSTPVVGYHFATWNSPEVSGITGDTFTMPAKAVTVTANFAGNQTTVSFDNGTGRVNLENIFGEPVNKPANPAKPGYTFVRWNVTADGGLTWASLDSYVKSGMWNYTGVHNGNLAAYANWTVTPLYINNVTVNGVVTLSQNIANVGDIIHLEAIPNAGYHFDSWDVTDSAGNITVDSHGDFIMPARDVNAAALFLGNVTEVTFDNGTGVSTYSNVVGYSVQKPANPTRSGYTFAGWNVTFDGGVTWKSLDSYLKNGKWNYDGVHGGNLTVYADWKVYEAGSAPATDSTSHPSSTTPADKGSTQILPGNAYSDTHVEPTLEPASSSTSLPIPKSQFTNISYLKKDGFPLWLVWVLIGLLLALLLFFFLLLYRRRKNEDENYRYYRKMMRRRRKGWL